MERVAIIGNSGGGKSSLARAVAAARGLPLVEVDALLWRPGWELVPVTDYEAAHDGAIAGPRWVMDGLGRRESIRRRLARATGIVLVDMPLEVHLRLAEGRHRAWEARILDHPPGGFAEPPPLEAVLRTIHEVDREWMPAIRRWVLEAETHGAQVVRVASLAELEACRSAASSGHGAPSSRGR